MADYRYEDTAQDLNEKIMRLEYEIEEKTSRLLALKKENERLYDDVKEARTQAALFRTELENEMKIYEEELALRSREKNALQEQLDLAAVKVKKYDSLEKTVSEIKINADRDAARLMDEAEEKSMDAVTVIDFISRDVAKMKLDLEYLSKNENKAQNDLDEEIQLIIDLLNGHIKYLKNIKSGFYKMNNIVEYENQPEELALAHRTPRLMGGSYVD